MHRTADRRPPAGRFGRTASAIACLAWLVCGAGTGWAYAHNEAVDGLTLFGNVSALAIALYWSIHRAATGSYPG